MQSFVQKIIETKSICRQFRRYRSCLYFYNINDTQLPSALAGGKMGREIFMVLGVETEVK